jgi:hypothetical protein
MIFGYPTFRVRALVGGTEVRSIKSGITNITGWVHDCIADYSDKKLVIEIEPVSPGECQK